MIRAMGDEVRRVFRMTFVDGLAAFRWGERRHAGWWADSHLRLGFLVAAPTFLALLFGLAPSIQRVARPGSAAELGLALLVSLAANVVWFAVAAFSRSRAKV